MSNKLALAIAVIALVIGGAALFQSTGQTFGGQLFEFDKVRFVKGLFIGPNGAAIEELKIARADFIGMNSTHAATSTKPYDLAVSGIAPGDAVFAQFSTTSPNGGLTNIGWLIRGCHASSTAGYATCHVMNLTGGDAFLSARAVGSSTNVMYADI